MAREPIKLGSLKNTLGKLVSRTAGQMKSILVSNDINNVTGKLRRSVNPKVTQTANTLTYEYNFPYYSQYVDNSKMHEGTGISKKWTIKEGRLSKIPTNYRDPLRKMEAMLIQETAKLTVESIQALIKRQKDEFKKLK